MFIEKKNKPHWSLKPALKIEIGDKIIHNKNEYIIDYVSYIYRNEKDQLLEEEIALQIKSIVEKIASKGNFNQYTNLEEMKSNALIKIFAAFNTIDTARENFNPFAYFSEIVFNSFVLDIKKDNQKLNREIVVEEVIKYKKTKVFTDEIKQ